MPDWVLAVRLLDLMRIKVLILAIGFAALPLWAADPPTGAGPRWTRVGSRGVSVGLAGVVGGPVSDVAFSLDGRVLYVRTGSGRVWASSDLGETWERFQLAPGETSPFSGSRVITSDARAPSDDPGALVVVHPFDWPYLFALGRDLHRSIDGGETWINLTQDGLGSIIGPWQVSIAFSPLDRDTIAVSNSVGVWKSAGQGLDLGQPEREFAQLSRRPLLGAGRRWRSSADCRQLRGNCDKPGRWNGLATGFAGSSRSVARQFPDASRRRPVATF